MIALGVLVLAILLGFKWPGVALAGVLYTYQAGALAAEPLLGQFYVVAAVTVVAIRCRPSAIAFSAVDAAFIGFLAVYSATAAYAPGATLSLGPVWALLVPALGLYILGKVAISAYPPEALMREMLWAIIGLGAVFSALLLQENGVTQRARLEIGDATAVGVSQPFPILLCSTFLAAATLAWRRKWLATVALTLVGLFVTYVSVLSATRAVYVSILGTGVFFLIFRHKILRFKYIVMSATVLVALLVVFFTFFAEGTARALARLTINFGTDAFLVDASANIRLNLQALGIDMFLDNPLFGVGLGGYNELTGQGYPHNMIVEVASQGGLVAIFLLGVYVCHLLRAAFRLKIDETGRSLVLFFLVCTLVHMQFSFSLYMAKPLFMVTGLLSGVSGALVRSRSSRAAGRKPVGSAATGRFVSGLGPT